MPRKRRLVTKSHDDSDDDDFADDLRQAPPQRNAANARERARMRVLSKAFCRLKTTLPWVPADTKLSKLDTLRLATSYIAHLRAVLTDEPAQIENGHKHPLTLTWPFSFQKSDATSEMTSNDVGMHCGTELPQSNGWNMEHSVIRSTENNFNANYYY